MIGAAYDSGTLTGVFLSKQIILIVLSKFLVGIINGVMDDGK